MALLSPPQKPVVCSQLIKINESYFKLIIFQQSYRNGDLKAHCCLRRRNDWLTQKDR